MAAAATTTTGSKGVGVPIKLFKEAESHPVTVELKSGEVYRGTLEESEDSMSCLLKNVHHTGRDGRVMRLEAVYLRGSQIRFIVLPEVLKGAPLFQCVFFSLLLGLWLLEVVGGGGGGGSGSGRVIVVVIITSTLHHCPRSAAGARINIPGRYGGGVHFSLSGPPSFHSVPCSHFTHNIITASPFEPPICRKVRQFAEAKAKPLSSGRGGFGRGGKRGRGRGRVALPSEYLF